MNSNITEKILALIKEEFYFRENQPVENLLDEKGKKLKLLEEKCKNCQKCNLYKTSKNLVFSDGDYNSALVLVGEAPGEEEDIQGKPFVGRAGRLLTSILENLGVRRSSVYICNILKHRPPGNRNPEPEEIALCSPYLVEQLLIIKPRLIVALGNFSTKFLLNTKEGISSLRGIMRKSPLGYTVLPTYHPAAVLRNMNLIEDFKMDIKKAIELVEKEDKPLE
ncbi:MAG: uracil-DNA glycosylase [Brevinematia bacterium]